MSRSRGDRDRDEPDGQMPLLDHLRELRNRLFKSAVVISVGVVVGWYIYTPVFDYLTAPMQQVIDAANAQGRVIRLTITGIAQPFVLQLQVSAVVGLVITSPFWIYQLWAFITPGLHRKERRYAVGFAAAATPLFLAGVAVGYAMLPKALGLLLGFTPDNATNLPTVDNYLSFVIRMLLVFGAGFLLPVFVVALNFVGVISADNLKSTWRWTFIGVLIFAAVATPTGDPITMTLLATPILVLMAGAFGIAYVNDRRRARRSGEPDYGALDDEDASTIAAPERIDRPASLDEADGSSGTSDDPPGSP